MRPSWFKIAAALAGVWLLIGGAMMWLETIKPTAEKIIAYAEENDLAKQPESGRGKVIESVAALVNRLDYDERRAMNRQRKLEFFWKALTNPERSRYLELILPTGFKQMMENFNRMSPERRRRMVEKAVKDLRERGGEEMPPGLEPAQMQRIVNEGLKAFYSDATIDAKLDALPFLEELERTIKWSR